MTKIPKKEIMYRDNDKKIWKPAKIVKPWHTPRSVIIKDLNTNKTLRRHTVDLNFNNHYNFKNAKNCKEDEEQVKQTKSSCKSTSDNNQNVNRPNCDVNQPKITRYGRIVKPVVKLNL